MPAFWKTSEHCNFAACFKRCVSKQGYLERETLVQLLCRLPLVRPKQSIALPPLNVWNHNVCELLCDR